MACSDGNPNPSCMDVAVQNPDGSVTVRCKSYVPGLAPEKWPDCPKLEPIPIPLPDLGQFVRDVVAIVVGGYILTQLVDGDEDDDD